MKSGRGGENARGGVLAQQVKPDPVRIELKGESSLLIASEARKLGEFKVFSEGDSSNQCGHVSRTEENLASSGHSGEGRILKRKKLYIDPNIIGRVMASQQGPIPGYHISP